MIFQRVKEQTSQIYTATIKDENDAPIPLANIVSMVLTLYSLHSLAVINGRDDQDVKNLNDVTIHDTSGLLTWEMQPADNQVLDQNLVFETHRAIFEYVYDTDKLGKHEVDFEVINLAKVT